MREDTVARDVSDERGYARMEGERPWTRAFSTPGGIGSTRQQPETGSVHPGCQSRMISSPGRVDERQVAPGTSRAAGAHASAADEEWTGPHICKDSRQVYFSKGRESLWEPQYRARMADRAGAINAGSSVGSRASVANKVLAGGAVGRTIDGAPGHPPPSHASDPLGLRSEVSVVRCRCGSVDGGEEFAVLRGRRTFCSSQCTSGYCCQRCCVVQRTFARRLVNLDQYRLHCMTLHFNTALHPFRVAATVYQR